MYSALYTYENESLDSLLHSENKILAYEKIAHGIITKAKGFNTIIVVSNRIVDAVLDQHKSNITLDEKRSFVKVVAIVYDWRYGIRPTDNIQIFNYFWDLLLEFENKDDQIFAASLYGAGAYYFEGNKKTFQFDEERLFLLCYNNRKHTDDLVRRTVYYTLTLYSWNKKIPLAYFNFWIVYYNALMIHLNMLRSI